MNTTSIQNRWFDDAAPRRWARLSTKLRCVQDFGSAPEVIANLIIGAAKDGERDFVRLYKRAIRAFGVDDTPMLVVSVGHDAPVPAYASVTHAA